MKYKIFLGKRQRPLATPTRVQSSPVDPTTTYQSALFSRRLHPPPPISKSIDAPGWNLRFSIMCPNCNVLRIMAMNMCTL